MECTAGHGSQPHGAQLADDSRDIDVAEAELAAVVLAPYKCAAVLRQGGAVAPADGNGNDRIRLQPRDERRDTRVLLARVATEVS